MAELDSLSVEELRELASVESIAGDEIDEARRSASPRDALLELIKRCRATKAGTPPQPTRTRDTQSTISELHFMAPRHYDEDQVVDADFQEMLLRELQEIHQVLRQQLHQQPLSELQRRAESQGISAGALDAALKSEDPARSTIDLIVTNTLPNITQYQKVRAKLFASRDHADDANPESEATGAHLGNAAQLVTSCGMDDWIAKCLSNQIIRNYFGKVNAPKNKEWARTLEVARKSTQQEREAQHAADARRARLEAFAAAAAQEEAMAAELMASPVGEVPDEPQAHWVHERGALRSLHGDIESSATSVAATLASLQAKLAAASVQQDKTRQTFVQTKQQEEEMTVRYVWYQSTQRKS